jgi:hypothetical protein
VPVWLYLQEGDATNSTSTACVPCAHLGSCSSYAALLGCSKERSPELSA